MSNRLDRIEEEIGLAPFSSEQEQEQILLEQTLEQARRRFATNATNATAAKADLFRRVCPQVLEYASLCSF